MIFALVLLRLSYSMETSDCHAINYDINGTEIDCIVFDGTYINIYECVPGYTCQTDILNNTSSITSTECKPLNRNSTCTGNFDICPGMPCCTNNDCKSANCMYNVCTNLNSCTVDEDCVSNTFCDNEVCVDSYKTEDPCQKDSHCPIGNGCNHGICMPLLSLDIGSGTEDDKFCATGFAYNGTCESIQITVNKTVLHSPFVCFISDVCTYTLKYSGKFYSALPCLCGGVADTVGYCSSFVVYDYDYSMNLYSYLSYSSSNCGGNYTSTLNAETLLSCGSIGLDSYYSFIKRLYQGYYWNLYYSGILDNCALRLGLYDPKASLSGYIYISLMIILL